MYKRDTYVDAGVLLEIRRLSLRYTPEALILVNFDEQ